MLIKILGQLLIICAFATLPFITTLHGDFVFDDSEAITKNKDVYSESFIQPFYNDFWGTSILKNYSHKSYRPLTVLSFRLNYVLSGRQFVAFHFKITNLICHVLCCVLVWLTYRTLLKRSFEKIYWTDPGFLAALLFAVHPIHVESVSGIVGRADILAAITFFLAFLIYDRAIHEENMYKQYIYLISTGVLAGISMLFKENGVTVLGFCIVYEFIIKFKMKQSSSLKMSIKSYEARIRVLFIVIASILLIYTRWAIMGRTKPEFKPIDNPAAFANTTFTKVATYNYVYFMNLLLLIWPYWLCYDWSMGCIPLIESLNDNRIIFIILMYVYGILILKMLMDKTISGLSKRYITLGILLTAIPYLPAANIFYPVGFVIAERVLYIPSAGFCLLIAIGLSKILQRRRLKKIGIFLFYLLLLVFGMKCWRRSLQWRNEYELFTSGLYVCPLNAKVHYNVAKVADAKQSTLWAKQEYREAIRLYPEYYQAMNNLANILKNEKQYSEAEFYFRTALGLKSDFPAAWMNLGIVFANTKRYQKARSAYQMALKFRRKYPDCFYNFGNLCLELNQTRDAEEHFKEAIRLNPAHNLAWTNLLALFDNTGQLKIALLVIPRAKQVLPNSPSVMFAIANIYGKLNRYEDAEKHFKKAIKLFGDKVQAIHLANLGVLYHRWKKYNLAQEMYMEALKIDEKFESALNNLKTVQKYVTN